MNSCDEELPCIFLFDDILKQQFVLLLNGISIPSWINYRWQILEQFLIELLVTQFLLLIRQFFRRYVGNDFFFNLEIWCLNGIHLIELLKPIFQLIELIDITCNQSRKYSFFAPNQFCICLNINTLQCLIISIQYKFYPHT